MDNTYKIEEYGLANFSKALEQAVLAGYRVDLNKNETVPQSYGGFHECLLVRETSTDLPVPPESVVTEVVPEVVTTGVSDAVVEVTSDVEGVKVEAPSAILASRGRPKKAQATVVANTVTDTGA